MKEQRAREETERTNAEIRELHTDSEAVLTERIGALRRQVFTPTYPVLASPSDRIANDRSQRDPTFDTSVISTPPEFLAAFLINRGQG